MEYGRWNVADEKFISGFQGKKRKNNGCLRYLTNFLCSFAQSWNSWQHFQQPFSQRYCRSGIRIGLCVFIKITALAFTMWQENFRLLPKRLLVAEILSISVPYEAQTLSSSPCLENYLKMRKKPLSERQYFRFLVSILVCEFSKNTLSLYRFSSTVRERFHFTANFTKVFWCAQLEIWWKCLARWPLHQKNVNLTQTLFSSGGIGCGTFEYGIGNDTCRRI